jgi:hypothetical protein
MAAALLEANARTSAQREDSMKRIILLGIGAVCVPSLILLGYSARSAARGYDGGVASAAGYDGGLSSTSSGYEAGVNRGQSAAPDMDSSSKQSATASSNGAAWEGGMSSR